MYTRLRVNIGKNKLMVAGREPCDVLEYGKFFNVICGRVRGVRINTILCTHCAQWIHKRYSGLRNLNGVAYYCYHAYTNKRDVYLF